MLRSTVLILVAGLAVATQSGCTHASAPAPASPAPDCIVIQSQRFALQSEPWINLHHFLYQWARGLAEKRPDDDRPPVEVPERTQPAGLTEQEQQARTRAVDYYRDNLVARDLVDDRALIGMREELSSIGCSNDDGKISDAALRTVLTDAMPVYRRHWWPAHRAANAEWIRTEMNLLRTYEPMFSRRLAAAYGAAWRERA